MFYFDVIVVVTRELRNDKKKNTCRVFQKENSKKKCLVNFKFFLNSYKNFVFAKNPDKKLAQIHFLVEIFNFFFSRFYFDYNKSFKFFT